MARARIIAGAIALAVMSAQPAVAHPHPDDEPGNGHSDHAVGGVMLGTGGAVLFGAIGGGLGWEVHCRIGCAGWGLPGLLVGGAAGYLLGASAGVGVVWNHEGASNPYGHAFLGALAGGLVGFGLGHLIHTDAHEAEHAYDHPPSIAVTLIGPIVGASLGAYLGHRHPGAEVQIGSLLQLRDGELAAGIPIPVRTTIDGAALTTVPLAAGRF